MQTFVINIVLWVVAWNPYLFLLKKKKVFRHIKRLVPPAPFENCAESKLEKKICLASPNVLLSVAAQPFPFLATSRVEFSRSDELSLGDPILPLCETRWRLHLCREQQQAWCKTMFMAILDYAANRFGRVVRLTYQSKFKRLADEKETRELQVWQNEPFT